MLHQRHSNGSPFFNTLLTSLCTEERVFTALWSLLIDELLQRYRKVVERIQFLLRTERSGNLLRTNHYFSETLDKLRSERSAEPTESFPLDSSNAAQGTDYDLITGPDTPLHVFSPQFVVELSDERLEAAAGEDITSIQQRKSVEKEVESLTEGRRILIA